MKNETAENKNPAAVALGRMAAGVPKNFSATEIARRRKLMLEINKRRELKRKGGSPLPPQRVIQTKAGR